MSFKVKDLAVTVGLGLNVDDTSTCTTMTKTSGDTCGGSIYWQDGGARQRNLAALKAQLRKAATRS